MVRNRPTDQIPGLRDRMISGADLTRREMVDEIKKLKARRADLEAEVCTLSAKLKRHVAECVKLLNKERRLRCGVGASRRTERPDRKEGGSKCR